MSILTDSKGNIKLNGRKIAQLRQGGNVCDIRRHNSGFLYAGGMKVAVIEELLESLSDDVLLQFKNLDSGDVWTTTVHNFRHMSEPFQAAGWEPQRSCLIDKLNHTRNGRKPRVNELVHISEAPISGPKQMGLFG